jgi:predicted lipoprotein
VGKRRHVLKGLAAAGLAPVWRPATLFAAEPITEERFAEINASLVAHHGTPRFAHFAETAEVLAAALQGYEAGEVTLDEVRPAFDVALHAWMGVQHLRLGALEEQMRDFRIEFWPDKKNRVGRQLAAALKEERADLLDPAFLADASVALQGFPALERLLYEDPVEPGSYGAKLAVTIGTNLQDIAASLMTSWAADGATAKMLLHPGSTGARFATVKDITAAFVGSMAVELEFVAQRKLEAPLGESIEKARPRLAESWRSGQSMANVTANLAAVLELYKGPEGHPGLMTLVTEAGFADLAGGIESNLVNAHQASDGLGPALAPLVEDEAARQTIQSIADEAETARHVAAGEMAGALGLVLGFNSLDGD